MSLRGRFWTGYAVLVLLLAWAASALAQSRFEEGGGSGRGVTGPSNLTGGGIPTDPNLQDAVTTYVWDTAPSTTAETTPWQTVQSTTGAWTIVPTGPSLCFQTPGATPIDKRVKIWEQGARWTGGFLSGEADSAQKTRVRVLFSWDCGPTDGMGTNGVFQFSYGDTTYIGVDRTLVGFGLLCLGSGKLFGGLQTNVMTGYVGTGTDTTYVPLVPAWPGTSGMFKIYIDYQPGHGVDFYVDNKFRATISTPAIPAGTWGSPKNAMAFHFNGSADGGAAAGGYCIGFLTVQRAWPGNPSGVIAGW